jgi:hypothetical protein
VRASAANSEFNLAAARMIVAEFPNPLGIRRFEAVDRPVIISDDREVPVLAKEVKDFLFGSV